MLPEFKSEHAAERPTLQTAREWAPVLEREAANGRKAMVHAIADDRAILVPADYDPAATAAPVEKPPAAKAKAAKGRKKSGADLRSIISKDKVSAKKAAKRKPAGDTKAAIAHRMLTAKGTTRAAIVEACGGWGIDIKQSPRART